MREAKLKKLHLVFKTHLDIGFTDMAEHVLDHYLHVYLPAAIALAKEANRPGQPKRFVWTVGAFLPDLGLRTLKGEALENLDAALRRGDIAYHALPFTTHTELCSRPLLEAGLRIAARLDERYGRQTTAGKMTDVPGHTRGLIGPLAEHGITFLHIGINDVAKMPQVPPLFLWEDSRGRQLAVAYARGYGGLCRAPGQEEALLIQHGNDNMGPPTPAQLDALYAELEERYPGVEIEASTLDAYARGLRPHWGSLPVIRQEIGDTWIHGTATDPAKVAGLRALERLAEDWEGQGALEGLYAEDGRPLRQAFLEQLLLVCEHTWGLDTKKFLTDFRNWTRADFERARKLPAIPDGDGDLAPYQDFFRFARREFEQLKPKGLQWAERSYAYFERSHEEQRDYLRRAANLLPEPLRGQAAQALDAVYKGGLPSLGGELAKGQSLDVGKHLVDAMAEGLRIRCPGGKQLTVKWPLYQQTGQLAFRHLLEEELEAVSEHRNWAVVDNSKPGAEHSDAPLEDSHHLPGGHRLARDGATLQLEGSFDAEAHRLAGCPRGYRLRLEPRGEGLLISLHLYDKPANRKPEAIFLPVEAEGALVLYKLGEPVRPGEVVAGGNRAAHAAECCEWIFGGRRALKLTPLDGALFCPGQPRLLDFRGGGAENALYLNLYNNLWGTNFKMWYEEDIFCRFLLAEGPAEEDR